MGKIFQVKCVCCGSLFNVNIEKYNRNIKQKYNFYCSEECQFKYKTKAQLVQCKQCGKEFIKKLKEIKKSINHFCCHSCSATYNNTHKTHGTKRSKLELYLEQQLILLYSELDIHFNCKDAINSELDIYIPELRLAFELNGIYHYEPIHGSEKLEQIQNNDTRKFAACQENNISLCIIDISSLINFKEERARKYLDIITNIIDDILKTIKSNIT